MIKLKLSSAKVGKYLVLRNFNGINVKKRLNAVGLLPGTEITVKQECKSRGPIICEIKGANIALGHGLAKRVELEEL